MQHDNKLFLLTDAQRLARIERISNIMRRNSVGSLLISDNANKYYLTGRVFDGWILLNEDGTLTAFVKRPQHLEDKDLLNVRKIEDLSDKILASPQPFAVEKGTLTVSEFSRLQAIVSDQAILDATPLLREARSIKAEDEIDKVAKSAQIQTEVYSHITKLYTLGMTDIELQIEIERCLRLHGCLGQFRINGSSMELFMANILAGDNADNPSPYDFAMGGAGINPSLPVGADGSIIVPGNSIMVDANGNFTGYMSDMTRTFALGELSDIAYKAHRCSIEICNALAQMGTPGTPAKALYETALDMARASGLEDYFMGHRQKAGFVGHGVGIEINEAPVLAPRSRDILVAGNIIALEPKFVIPGTGAVGIENTYVVKETGMHKLTLAPEEILSLG